MFDFGTLEMFKYVIFLNKNFRSKFPSRLALFEVHFSQGLF